MSGGQVAVMTSTTLDHLLSDEQLLKNKRDENSARLQKTISIVTLIALVAMWIWANYKTSQLPVVNTISVQDAHIVGNHVVCPGDVIHYAYLFHAEGTGVLVRDRVLWRVTPPPKTMVFSASRRFILAEAIDQKLTEAWHIPESYLNPETDLEEPLPAGDYRLIFAISSPSRSTVIAIESVDLIVRGDC